MEARYFACPFVRLRSKKRTQHLHAPIRLAYRSSFRLYLPPLLSGSIEYRYVRLGSSRPQVGYLPIIGNAKIMNAETGNDLLTETNMTSYEYT